MALDTTNALDTLANIKTHLRITSGDTTYDTQLETMIDGLSIAFNRYTRRDLLARDRTDYYDGDGSGILYVHHWPINSITSLHYDTDRDFDSDTLVATSDYFYNKDEGVIELESGGFPDARKCIKLVSNAGFTSIPADLLMAFRDQVKAHWRWWMDNLEKIRSVTKESVSYSFDNSVFLPVVQRVLDTYRRKGYTGGMTT